MTENRIYVLEDYDYHLRQAVDKRLTVTNREIARREANHIKEIKNITHIEYGEYLKNK